MKYDEARLKAGNMVKCIDGNTYRSRGQISNYSIMTNKGFKYFKEPPEIYQPDMSVYFPKKIYRYKEVK